MSKKILLIEDNVDMRDNIQEILELSGYNVLTASNGKNGVKSAIESIPDLIICDVMMPEMDGYETLYLLSKNEKTKHIPFIFLTAKAEKTDFRKGMNLGADDYLTKPFEEMELLKVVETRLERSEAFRHNFENSGVGLNSFIDKVSSLNELKEISRNKKSKHYKKKDILFHEGDFIGNVFLIEKGKVKTYRINDDGKEYITGLYAAGDFIGYKALIEGSDHVDSAMAMEETEVYRLNRDEFLKLLYENKEISQAFIKMLSGNLIEKEKELVNLAYNSVRKRVADGLVQLADKYADSNEESFSITIQRDDLASIVGTSTESVIRVLSDFKSEKLIEIKAGAITVFNVNKLRNLRF